jgi:two-component system nitrate/nitrite response regulator NarL
MTRLMLYTDEPTLAKGLETILASSALMKLSSICYGIADLAGEIQATSPDVLLMDLTPDLTFGVLLDLQRRFPGSRIVLWVRTISTELAYQSIEHGVRGILRKTHSPDVLLKCLQMVADGGLWFEETLKASFTSMRTVSLTRRESQLVGLLSQGLKNKEIAATLFISEGTVKVYLSRLFHKLDVKDRFELALYGLKNMSTGEEQQVETRAAKWEHQVKKDVAQSQWLRSLALQRPPARARAVGDYFEP